jgi:hypothetical protein
MKIRFIAIGAVLLWAGAAHAQGIKVVASCPVGVSPTYDVGSGGATLTVDTSGNLCTGGIQAGGFPSGSTALSGNSTGSTSAVVGTLGAASGKTTYICGFNVQAIGGTATVGPITVAGLVGASQVYQTDVNSATVGKTVAQAAFSPCIPASATNTAITVTTTANGTATAVDVNSWGYRQ